MGDIGDMDVVNPILPPVEGLPLRTKSTALHIEDTTTSLTRELTKDSQKVLSTVTEIQAIDTPMACSNAPSSIASHKSDMSDDSSELDLERERQPLEPILSPDPNKPSRAPSPIRGYREEPRLWVDDGPEAGKATAEWKEKFIPLLHEHTANMSVDERTKFFDELVEDDKERYLPPIATYYFENRDQIPERKLSDRAQKKVDLGFRPDNSRIQSRQWNVFRGWDWYPDAPKVVVEERVGPKNETIPGEIPECEHCIKKEKRSKMRKRASTIFAPVTAPFRRRRANIIQVAEPKNTQTEETVCTDDRSSDGPDVNSTHSKSSSSDHEPNTLRRARTQLQT